MRLRIPVSNDIREDLHAMQQLVKNAEYTYAAPHTAAGHSDRCTALALALRAAESAQSHHIGVIRHAARPASRRGWSYAARAQRAKLHHFNLPINLS